MIGTLIDYDKQNLQEIIDVYDKTYPHGENSIAATLLTANQENDELKRMGKRGKHGEKVKNQANMRLTVALPPGLYILIKKKYPTMFSENIKWFKANFPMFVINK